MTEPPFAYEECYKNDGQYGKIDHAHANAISWRFCDATALEFVEKRINGEIEDGRCTWPDLKDVADIEDRLAKRWNKMKARFDEPTEHPEAVQNKEKFDTYYFTEPLGQQTLKTRSGKEEGAPLLISAHLSLGLNLEDKILHMKKTYSKNNGRRAFEFTCSSGIIEAPGGLILGGFDNDAKRDENRYENQLEAQSKEVQQRQALRQSEIVFQQLMRHFHQNKVEVGKLSFIWRADISNWITRRTVLKAHQAMEISGLCWGKFTENASDAKERQQFRNLIATQNGSVGMWLLAGHPDVLKSRINEIYTFPEGSLPAVTDCHIVFSLGPRED